MNIWDQRYAVDGFVFGTRPNDYLQEQAGRFSPGQRILSIGEGEGRNAVYLASLGLQVSAVDASAEGARKALRLAQERGVEIYYQIMDLMEFSFDQKWDGMVSVFCHLPPAVRVPVFARMAQALRPGGLLIMESYSKQQLGRGTGGPSDPAMLYSMEMLRDDFGDQGQFLQLEEREREIAEGTAHVGPSFVVQMVWQKNI